MQNIAPAQPFQCQPQMSHMRAPATPVTRTHPNHPLMSHRRQPAQQKVKK